jgi:hypothetical protein
MVQETAGILQRHSINTGFGRLVERPAALARKRKFSFGNDPSNRLELSQMGLALRKWKTTALTV